MMHGCCSVCHEQDERGCPGCYGHDCGHVYVPGIDPVREARLARLFNEARERHMAEKAEKAKKEGKQ